MCITNKEITEKVVRRAESGGWECFHACLRGCLFILGVDCIIEKATFEQRHEESSKELSLVKKSELESPGEGVCLECLGNN